MRRTLAVLATLFAGPGAFAAGWEQLPALPDKEGFAGMFAGVSGRTLIAAGGANFPDKKPWEGGTKVWYDAVYALDRPDGTWAVAGKLPRPLGYGVFATHGGGVVCAGGSNATGHFADVFRLLLQNGKLVTTPLPSLPVPVAMGCGALIGDTLYVAGGSQKLDATSALKSLYSLDLADPAAKWQRLDDIPGAGRTVPIAAVFDGALWVVGGVDLAAGPDGMPVKKYLKDAYRYDPGKGWSRLPDLPRPLSAAPSPAAATETEVAVFGGDDGAQVGQPLAGHKGFPPTVTVFDAKSKTWREAANVVASRVTVPLTEWQGRWVIPSGEVRPGVRSPEVWATKAVKR